jgi:hypothetical protein
MGIALEILRRRRPPVKSDLPPELPVKQGDEPTEEQKATVLREAVNYYIRSGLRAPDVRAICEEFCAAIDAAAGGGGVSGDVTVLPTSATAPAEAGTGTFAVSLTSEGSWMATAIDPWLHIDSPTGPQTASGTVEFSMEANNGVVGQPPADRVGTVAVNNAIFEVTQSPWDVLPVELSPKEATLAATSSVGNKFDVTITGSGTSGTWTVDIENAARLWLIVASPTAPQSTNGTVTYSVQANALTTERTGKFFVNGQPFTVTQAAGGV